MDESQLLSAAEIAEELAAALDDAGCEYAIGGALALGCWTTPRGTVDIDVTLFLPPDDLDRFLDVLAEIEADFAWLDARQALKDNGYCRIQYLGRVLDVFVPITDFYALAKERRAEVPFKTRSVKVWDAETLCVFKMMFFRRKDLADVEQLIRAQGEGLDVAWVDARIVEIFGQRNPRVSTWREIVAEVRGA